MAEPHAHEHATTPNRASTTAPIVVPTEAPVEAPAAAPTEGHAAPAPEIPKKYKAAVYDNPGTISTKIIELETPEPGPGEVLIKLSVSGVCHSDLGIMTNGWPQLPAPTAPGQVGGHEGIGRVVKLGPGAESMGVKIGDRVGIKWIASACGRCVPCLAGHDTICENGKISGYFTPGTFQQYVVSAAHYVTPIPDGISDFEAASHLCAGVTVYSALRRSGAQSGDTIAVIGAGGGLGHIAVQLAARGFALRVIGIDADPKKQIVLDSGAEHFIGLGSKEAPVDTAAEVKKLTNGVGVKAVIVVAAANGAYASAVPMLKFGGCAVCVGMPEGQLTAIASAYPQLLIGRELSIVGSAVGNRREAIEVLDFAARGVVKVHVREEKLANLTEVFKEMREGKVQGRVVVDLVNV